MENEVVNNVQVESPKPEPKKKNLKVLIIPLVIVTILVVLAIISYYLYFSYNIEWKKNGNIKLDYITATTLELEVKTSINVNKKDLKVSTTCGEAEIKKSKIKWNLKDSIGDCEITVSYKLKKISKKYTVINFTENQVGPLDLGEEEINYDSDEDLDYDGLTNKEEKELGTNPRIADTDMDGLEDKYEIEISKTDPLKADSDDDGINDADEIELKLDPLKADSKGDGVKDGERTLTYTKENDNVTMTITGKGNIVSTIVNVNQNTKISDQNGMINKLYTFYTDGNLESATVVIKYTDEELAEKNIKEDNLSLYYYNVDENRYEEIPTTVNKENKTITATLSHFSSYIVADKEQIKQESETEILIVLDNSWSLYTNEQYEEYTGNEYQDKLDGFDSEGLRFDITKKLVEKLGDKDYKIGLSEFRRDYANAVNIGSSTTKINEQLDNMMGQFITNTEGTNITGALENGMKEFSDKSDNKYIVILTDGQDSSLKSNVSSIVEKAIKNDIKICAVGFGGSQYNDSLAEISNESGCKFFASTDVNGLSELFDNINTELSKDLVDIDDDGESDGLLIADSGFVVNKDGFSFPNYSSNYTDGHCYGMASFVQLYYSGDLPFKKDKTTIGDSTAHGYNINNTFFSKKQNLYDYKLKTNELKYVFGYEAFGEEQPADLYELDGDNLTFKKEYLKAIKGSDIYIIDKAKTTIDSKKQQERYGVTYDTYTSLLLDEDKMQKSEVLDSEDKELLNAIYTLFIKQNQDERISSSSNFTLNMRELFNSESITYTGKDGFLNVLASRINNGEAPVIVSSYSGGLHAVNAISLIQDIENPNTYYIGVYDNNYVGEKRYVTLQCKKNVCYTKANEYYTSSKEPVRMTPSKEFDLKYFQ